MAKVLRFPAGMAIPFLALCLVAAPAAVSRAADKPDLTGNWKFNSKQSDDAQAKVRDAQERSSSSRRRSGGYPGSDPNGGGYPAGGGIPGTDYPGGGSSRVGIGGPLGGIGVGVPVGGIGRRGREDTGISGQELEALAAAPRTLKIEQSEKQISIRDDSGHTRTLYADGKKHKEEDANGKKTSAKTQWEGDRLTTESKVGRSGKLTESYRLAEDGKRLEVTARLDDPALESPLFIHRVYDRASAPAQ